jgi:hypothetical protein
VIRVFDAVLGGLIVVGTSVGVLQSFVIPRGRVRGAVTAGSPSGSCVLGCWSVAGLLRTS